MVCGSLIELSNSSARDPYYRFVHRAAIEFFESYANPRNDPNPCSRFLGKDGKLVQSNVSQMFHFSQNEAEMELILSCLCYLTYWSPYQPLSRNMLEGAVKSEIQAAFPFLQYAAVYWSYHLKIRFLDRSSFGNQFSTKYNIHLIL